MGSDFIISKVAAQASLPYQERWIIGGTRDGYILADDVLEGVSSLGDCIDQEALSVGQSAALHDLIDFVGRRGAEALSAQTPEDQRRLVLGSEVWKTMREKAALVLSTYNVTIETMSLAEASELIG